jgi:uncharacterized membrane protein YkoI
MKQTVRKVFLASVVTLMLVAIQPISAVADSLRLAQNRNAPETTQLISADRAAAIAQGQTGGKVLGVKLSNGKRPVYLVKILLNSKRVKTVRVDARTGKLR